MPDLRVSTQLMLTLVCWIGCNNHKLTLCFKHLIPQFPSIFKTDAFLLSLSKYRPYVKNFLEESATTYGQEPITSACPSETRCASHDRAFKAFYKGCKQFLDALAICYDTLKESEALGLFNLTVIIATLLMLLDMFNSIRPLIIFLQKKTRFLVHKSNSDSC